MFGYFLEACCVLIRDRKGMALEGRGTREEGLGGIEGGRGNCNQDRLYEKRIHFSQMKK